MSNYVYRLYCRNSNTTARRVDVESIITINLPTAEATRNVERQQLGKTLLHSVTSVVVLLSTRVFAGDIRHAGSMFEQQACRQCGGTGEEYIRENG